MTTVFLTALEVQKHLKNAFKISKEYYFPQKTKIQIYTQTKFLIACEEKNKDFLNMQGQCLNLPHPPIPFSLSLSVSSHIHSFSGRPYRTSCTNKE